MDNFYFVLTGRKYCEQHYKGIQRDLVRLNYQSVFYCCLYISFSSQKLWKPHQSEYCTVGLQLSNWVASVLCCVIYIVSREQEDKTTPTVWACNLTSWFCGFLSRFVTVIFVLIYIYTCIFWWWFSQAELPHAVIAMMLAIFLCAEWVYAAAYSSTLWQSWCCHITAG